MKHKELIFQNLNIASKCLQQVPFSGNGFLIITNIVILIYNVKKFQKIKKVFLIS